MFKRYECNPRLIYSHTDPHAPIISFRQETIISSLSSMLLLLTPIVCIFMFTSHLFHGFNAISESIQSHHQSLQNCLASDLFWKLPLGQWRSNYRFLLQFHFNCSYCWCWCCCYVLLLSRKKNYTVSFLVGKKWSELLFGFFFFNIWKICIFSLFA